MERKEVDKNLIVAEHLDHAYVFYDAESEPMRLYGLLREGEHLCRYPYAVVKTANSAARIHHADASGGRVRFQTNSRHVAVRIELEAFRNFPHMALTGTAGMDLYASSDAYTERYCGTFIPPKDLSGGYESEVDTLDEAEKLITVNLPLWSWVKKLYIGIEEGATIHRAPDYAVEQPVVLYGSSITQGGCVSKPGSSYALILSRRLNCNIRNLGLSGGAKAEDSVIDYLCKQDMRAFILDYDYNAPDAEHLQNTHEKLFLAVRRAHPDVPIIMMPRPKRYETPAAKARRAIIEQTYHNALERGDRNVYYLDHLQLTDLVGFDGTVDGVHPTDSGHLSMANAIEPVLRKIVKL